MFKDKFGRPLPIHDDLSKRAWDRRRIEGEERRRHDDWAERARLLLAIEDEIGHRGLLSHVAHDSCGLPRGSLKDQTLATDTLRTALAHLRTLPL